VYGINTGFGRFSNVKIPHEKLRDLQYNLIRSHSTGVGKLLPIDPSRRIVALRINNLAKGFSGISLDVVHRLVDFFNSGCVPWIPQAGTVGASGDLVPLAHIGLSVIGEGLVWDPKLKKYEPAAQVFERYGLKKAELKAKDGLSLINGTQFICGVGSCALEESTNIIKSV
jgi:histidine ammonia-lyase